MKLKLLVDRLSQPCRAMLIFCRLNGIEFEEVTVDFCKRENLSPEYQKINPMKLVPAIQVDGEFNLFESHAILRFLASAFPGVADHWYPADVFKRAKIDSVLDWHHSNLRHGTTGLVFNSTVGPLLAGLPPNLEAAAEAEKVLLASLPKIESFWLKGDGHFLLGNSQPSIADLILVCEIMQLEGGNKKVQSHCCHCLLAGGRAKGRLTKRGMKLKLFVDRLSQPSRAIIIFCKVNGIKFEEVQIDLTKGEHLTPEFKEINPMQQVPVIEVDEGFKLFESHAILRFLACAFPGVPDHWYPADLFKRAQINSILDWHHANLRHGSAGLVFNSKLAPFLGLPLDLQAAAEAEKVLSASLAKIESFWLKGDGNFLLGSSKPSIADLSLVCETMQLEVLDEKVRKHILDPHEKVLKWIDDTRNATQPYFDEIHGVLFQAKEMLMGDETKIN